MKNFHWKNSKQKTANHGRKTQCAMNSNKTSCTSSLVQPPIESRNDDESFKFKLSRDDGDNNNNKCNGISLHVVVAPYAASFKVMLPQSNTNHRRRDPASVSFERVAKFCPLFEATKRWNRRFDFLLVLNVVFVAVGGQKPWSSHSSENGSVVEILFL